MAQAWPTVRVFISSTFRDMQAERDHLVRFVFPRQRKALLWCRIRFIEVDLRWRAASDQVAQEVCRWTAPICAGHFHKALQTSPLILAQVHVHSGQRHVRLPASWTLSHEYAFESGGTDSGKVRESSLT